MSMMTNNLLFLDLSHNSDLQIHDLRWILQLSSLKHLDLSYVDLSTETLWVKWVAMLPSLLELRLSHCFLNTITHPYLGSVNFSSSLELLDISENFYYEIPKWLFNLSSSISYLDLSFNHLWDQIPKAMSNFWHLQFLLLKSNYFSGSIPEWVGQYKKLEQLDISSNFFSGPIPDSLGNISSLVHLDVRHNQLTGSLPKSLGQLSKLQRFLAGYNKLSGPISFFLCQTESWNENLEVLEMSHNHFSGLLPLCWIHRIKYLKMILLRSNNFFGPIPQQICQLSNLKVLDLADNKLTGSIPKCLGNITAMAGTSSSDLCIKNYNCTGKGLMIGESRPNFLKYIFVIDLSMNDLSGLIPLELFSLVALISLNLSHNHLTKNIPNEIGHMKRLEALDLSRNQLVGEIPQSMTNLFYLSFLNLSYNNLSGKIPMGNQLQSFDVSSYMGNPELYGAPLTKDNTEDETPNSQDGIPSEKKHSSDDEFKAWFYMGMAIGFAYGFWSVCLALFYVSAWRHAYFRFLNNVNDRIYVFVALKTKWLRLRLDKWQYHK